MNTLKQIPSFQKTWQIMQNDNFGLELYSFLFIPKTIFVRCGKQIELLLIFVLIDLESYDNPFFLSFIFCLLFIN